MNSSDTKNHGTLLSESLLERCHKYIEKKIETTKKECKDKGCEFAISNRIDNYLKYVIDFYFDNGILMESSSVQSLAETMLAKFAGPQYVFEIYKKKYR